MPGAFDLREPATFVTAMELSTHQPRTLSAAASTSSFARSTCNTGLPILRAALSVSALLAGRGSAGEDDSAVRVADVGPRALRVLCARRLAQHIHAGHPAVFGPAACRAPAAVLDPERERGIETAAIGAGLPATHDAGDVRRGRHFGAPLRPKPLDAVDRAMHALTPRRR